MSEHERIHSAIDDGHQKVRDALNIVHMRIYQSDDQRERHELLKVSNALTEALLSLGEARHRANLQKELAPQIVPMPYPYPVPQRAPWEHPTPPYQPIWVGGPEYVPVTREKTTTGGTITSPAQRTIVTNIVEA